MFEYVRIMFPRIGCSGNFCMLYINIPVFLFNIFHFMVSSKKYKTSKPLLVWKMTHIHLFQSATSD
jgi:hypothetical protein